MAKIDINKIIITNGAKNKSNFRYSVRLKPRTINNIPRVYRINGNPVSL